MIKFSPRSINHDSSLTFSGGKCHCKYSHHQQFGGGGHSLRVPTWTGKTGKLGKMVRHFPVREKSGNFEQTGKVREKSGKTTQNTGKLRELQKKIICYFSMIFK